MLQIIRFRKLFLKKKLFFNFRNKNEYHIIFYWPNNIPELCFFTGIFKKGKFSLNLIKVFNLSSMKLDANRFHKTS